MAHNSYQEPEALRKHRQVRLDNPWLVEDSPDVLYHLGMGSESHDLQKLFGDVKFVCMGGTASRMRHFAKVLAKTIDVTSDTSTNEEVRDLTGHAGRYSMFKVGPVLSISHGIGAPSLSILLHEIIKLLHHAKCTDVTFFRIGTCGGIDLEPGTVVITNAAVDELLNPKLQVVSLGRLVERPCSFDPQLVRELSLLGENMSFPVTTGVTLFTNDFYEGQGRLDGAFCDYSPDQKMAYLRKLQSVGVKNIEMETQVFGAAMHRAKLRGTAVCVTLVDRLREDQVVIATEDYLSWQERPQQLILDYITQELARKK